MSIKQWFRGRAAPTRAVFLAARVLRNGAVREMGEDGERGAVILIAPLRPSALRRVLGARRVEKRFALDALGAEVWRGIDNRRTVEDLIRRFAGAKRVNLREAEVAVVAFLKLLARRGLVALGRAGG